MPAMSEVIYQSEINMNYQNEHVRMNLRRSSKRFKRSQRRKIVLIEDGLSFSVNFKRVNFSQ